MPQTLLIIDDDELTRSMLAMLLEEDGWQVVEAESGEAALEQIQRDSIPDVVLSDLQMPGLSGELLANALRKKCGSHTRLLAMTATIKGETAGFEGWLQKPVDAAAVRASLEGRFAIENREVLVVDLSEDIYEKLAKSMPVAQIASFYSFALADAEKRLEKMRAAVEAGQGADFCAQAHALKGSAGMVGAICLQKLAASLEEDGISLDTGVVLDEIVAAIARLRSILAERVSAS